VLSGRQPTPFEAPSTHAQDKEYYLIVLSQDRSAMELRAEGQRHRRARRRSISGGRADAGREGAPPSATAYLKSC
jgi:hypothetical protein